MEGPLRDNGVGGKLGEDKPTSSVLENKGGSSDSVDGTGKLISASTTRSSSAEMTPDRPKTRPRDENADECSSFALFNESFDTISQTGRDQSPTNASDAFAMAGPVLSPPAGRSRMSKARRPVDISLPKLKHGGYDSSDCSIGDISPIKVAFNSSDRAATEGRGVDAPPHFISHPNETFWQQTAAFDNVSNPFFVIRSSARALQVCKYPLPCLQGVDLCQVNMSPFGNIQHYRRRPDDMAADVSIGLRRVEAAICAFGGNLQPKHSQQILSCFRVNQDAKRARQRYENELPKRYSLGGSRISWEVEEGPPVANDANATPAHFPREPSPVGKQAIHEKKPMTTTSAGPPNTTAGGSSGATQSPFQVDASKGKYRCKLCGQPKQNHECPYRPSLQRSIGVMVYPAVNSFTAAEPGTIAPPLNKMNNFVSYDSDHGSHDKESAPYDASSRTQQVLHPSTVSPDTLRGGTYFHPPQSPLSAQSDEITSLAGQKRHASSSPDRFPFVASLTLRAEHYRAVTAADSATSYNYPSIPLSFSERKKLSDTLFCLARGLPSLTRDCALVLRNARHDWDQAVAELLTQVIIGFYCAEGDLRLDGLQRYLLSLGISC